MGVGPDHSIYDVYIGGSLWQSFDGYAASADEENIGIELDGEGPHLLEIRNRAEQNSASSGYKVRFKQLVVPDREYDLHTIEYAYDNLQRLTEARYNPGTNLETSDGDLLRRYQYAFDRAGNRTQQIVSIAGTPTTTNYSYNAANQLTGDGTYTYEYDGNGNLRYKKLTGTPVEEYIWNRANRLVAWDNGTPADLLNYRYDGLNNRISRSLGTTSPVVTKYLLDLQPGLSVVLAATEDTDVTRYVHGPMGIHAQEDPVGAWSWMLQDGLGSVRNVVNNSIGVDEVRQDDPFGNPVIGAPYDYAATVYGFTGEVTETVNPLVHLRARDYNPALGVFTALDPFEGMATRPMSLNGYSWVEGNVPNMVDASGRAGIQSAIRVAGSRNIATMLSSGACGDVNQTLPDCTACEGRSPRDWYLCMQYCEPRRENGLEGVYLYLAQEYHGFRFDDSLPYGNSEQSKCIDVRGRGDAGHPNTRGVLDFVALSNEVARLTSNNLADYLYVMNTVLLQYESSGDALVYLSVALSRSFERGFCIGNAGLDADFDDNTPNQISTHIWAAIATTASPSQIGATSGGLDFANEFHEIWQDSRGATWQDYMATLVAGRLGSRLRSGEICPSQFGGVFADAFMNPMSHTYPGAKSAAEMGGCLPIAYASLISIEDVIAILLNHPDAPPAMFGAEHTVSSLIGLRRAKDCGNARRRLVKKSRLTTLLVVALIIGVVLYVVMTSIVLPIASALSRTPVPLNTYSPATVREVCQLLAIDSTDRFCREPSNQDAQDLESMLRRNYPIGRTTFDEIMPLLSDLPSISPEMYIQDDDFTPGGCVLPEQLTKHYSECMVLLSSEVGIVKIRFDEEETVISYGVSGSGGGGS